MFNFLDVREKFLKDIENFQSNQFLFLQDIISKNKHTVYGKKYNFEKIKTIEDYQKSLPITTYEDYENYIKLMLKGNNQILTAQKVLLFEPSSGSTGACKYIPYTESLKNDFIKGIEPWFADLFLTYPEILKGKHYWSLTPSNNPNKIVNNIKIGFDNDIEYVGKNLKPFLEDKIIKPCFTSNEDFLKKTALKLIEEIDMSFVFVWSPTLFSLILKEIKKIKSDFKFKNLKLISCWADGNTRKYFEELKESLPNVIFQEKGLLATEGIMSIPIENIGKLPCVNSLFFEFRDLENNKILLLKDLEIGKNYSIIITNSAGLYRYEIGDIIKVYKKYKNCPCIEFVSKANNVSDFFGEKINEFFVKNIIDKLNISKYSDFYLFAPKKINDDFFYVLYLKPNMEIPKDLSNKFEKELLKNFHYKYCKDLQQIQKMRIYKIEEENAEEIYINTLVKTGMKMGDIKFNCFSNCDIWNFIGKYIT